ncbi:MAG: hybrid sensor histidine kinase/response regulator [Deltaproteobacteria bacterium]|nr:hybrid sensor histidine kinase/response regulator [Deltaproteobacteria bacterium]
MKDDQFLEKLLATFRIEAQEHLKSIAGGLLELEKAQPGSEEAAATIETMYRGAHSLKGAARSVNITSIESICQAVESIFGALKAGRLEPSVELFDELHRATDTMGDLVTESGEIDPDPLIETLMGLLEAGAKPAPLTVPRKIPKAARKKGAARKGKAREPIALEAESKEGTVQEDASLVASRTGVESADPDITPRRERTFQAETVRISVEKLDPLLRQVEEMVSVKLTTGQRVSDLLSVLSTISQWKQKWSALTSSETRATGVLTGQGKAGDAGSSTGQIAKLMDFLNWNESFVKAMEAKLGGLAKLAETDARTHGQMVDDLLEDMMNVLMLPCSSLMELFPRLVRDLSRDAGKEVDLEIIGSDLEIDRRILEEMKDPLIHLVRNSIDHGIETPEERERKGKPRHGKVTVAFAQISGNQVELVVSDDGAGIDVVRVREAAVRRGMISEKEKGQMDGQDVLSLVFRSEVSTSPTVTSISGRGLGLAIVREKVENLGGNVSVATNREVGASFRILLPVTLSTFRGILVRAFGQPFIVPTASVERVARIKKDLVKTVGNRDTIEVDGKPVPLVWLGEILELSRSGQKNGDSDFIPMMILRSGETLVSFRVDAILQEQEVLVKGLGKQLSRVRNVAGATVLGSGKLVPILNVQDLVKSSLKPSHAIAGPALRVEAVEDQTRKILVVEDSITSRMLLKNILEASGYNVTTSVDGVDAWSALKTGNFDLVVSDVDMPRMNGFDLTSNIRSDERLADLPVVLVTSLGSREDRERGIDVGANAYIVKGNFDQNNLLETVERLI